MSRPMNRRPYVYVASSWRNTHYADVVAALRGIGAAWPALPGPDYGVHDFRDPAGYFQWSDVDPDWESWDVPAFRARLRHPAAGVGFDRDMGGLNRATACLLVGPCGRSAHLELGYAIGRGIATAAYLPERQEPELMYRAVDHILATVGEVLEWATDVLRAGVPVLDGNAERIVP